MRLADIKGDKAFEVLADLLMPVTSLCADEEFVEAINRTYIEGMQVALKKHPDDIKKMMAVLDLEDPETYEITLAKIPKKFMELVNDPDVRDLFMSQGQETEDSSGSATENTQEAEE